MMTTLGPKDLCRRLAALVAGLSVGTALQGAQPEPVAKPTAPIKIVRSEFVDDPAVGKDPFFPTSARRQPAKPATGTPVAGSNLKLKLGGISGAKENRLVILNNKTYSVGEEFEVKVENQTYKVRVEEIKDHSVIVNVEGATQELTMSQSF